MSIAKALWEVQTNHCLLAINRDEIDDSLVLLESFTSLVDAELARGLLDVHGIPTHLENEHVVTANWGWSNAVGGVRLMVPACRLDEARQVLDAAPLAEDEALPD